MSMRNEKVKNYHDRKDRPLNWVINAVGKWIAAEEYWDITGEEFKKKVEE
ncbi:XkdX family protein [Lacrimispora xylanolytica]|uniref:XkdX family protein n=1 Tax=Lacrimispora xylanolytica TaxID=29375 RepID=A0ABY7AEG2_9FIRM|nr:XkdX family protein [Lacrimispora xylanolytica]WAJ24842.1 XkdX family protein [Lacrimispora xylanolytica]